MVTIRVIKHVCRLCGAEVQRRPLHSGRKKYYYPKQCPNCLGKTADPAAKGAKIAAARRREWEKTRQPIGARRIHGRYYEIKVAQPRTWQLEHRYIAAQHLGRPLLPTEHVHHINHDPLDNRPENLEVLSPSEHAATHNPKVLRWARNHDACQQCGTTERIHAGFGLCQNCYMNRRNALRSHPPQTRR